MHIHSIHQACPAIPFICGRLGMPGLGCNKRYCPSDLPLRSIPPTPCCGSLLRPRVARVLWTTPLTACAYPLMHTPACPAASAGAVPQELSALLPPLALHLWFSAYGLVNIRNGRPVPSPLDLHGKQRAWKRPMYLSVESAQPLSRSVHMQNRGQTERPWRALCGISACSPLGEKASERGSNTFWGTFSVGGAAL